MKLYALRVSLVAAEPQLFSKNNISKDIVLFEQALLYSVDNPPENEHKEKLYSIKTLVSDDRLGVMAGMVAKAKILNGHDAEFKAFSVDDYPPMVWFWDRQQQVILLEKKTTVFQTATAACKAFSSITNNYILAEMGLRADIEPVLNESDNNFWHEYEKFECVESVTFELIPPNLFGNTEAEMKKALNDSQEVTNANRITTIFENKDTKLNLNSDGWLNNLVNWCRKGGGNWILRGRLSGHKKQLTDVKSERTAKIIMIEGQGITEIELQNYDADDVSCIIESCRSGYDYKLSGE
jgi:hypothetical protein